HVIVRQSAGVDARGGQGANVLWMHAIMNSFAGPWCFGRGDGRIEIDKSEIDLCVLQPAQRITPDVSEAQRTRYRFVCFLSKLDMLTRDAHVRFVQNWIHRMRQRLINAAPCHDVAAEKKAQQHEEK